MLRLQYPYVSILSEGKLSYGGNQQSADSAMIGKCGCGIIAATDTLLYLSRYHLREPVPAFRGLEERFPLSARQYYDCIAVMRRDYFPLIPHLGINGLMLMTGMEKFFRENRMPYRARWSVRRSDMWEKMKNMLREDIPVIMSIGPNFPAVWGNRRTCLYSPQANGELKPAAKIKAHYFTVTGMDENWLTVSSWGKKYYLNRLEFERYVKEHSAGFVSNILYITKR